MSLHANARTCPHCRLLIVESVLRDSKTANEVALQFKVSSRTVHKWIGRYRQAGTKGLLDKTSAPHSVPRRQMQPGKALHDEVMTLLHTPPSSHGFNRTTWRMQDIKATLDRQGTIATLNNIRAEIANAGLRWKQARIALTSKDPEYRAKLDAIKAVLASLSSDEAFFSIDELGPVAVKMRGGRSLQPQGQVSTVPQWQKSRGAFILTAALDLAKNQVTFFFSERKSTEEIILLVDRLREDYAFYRKLFLSWDSAPWHSSARLRQHVQALNDRAEFDRRPTFEVLPLPTSAQFLNVIESVFSGMARAILHNSDYTTLEDCKAAVTRYFADRNDAFIKDPKRAGKSIWGKERVSSAFSEANNCKDPKWMG